MQKIEIKKRFSDKVMYSAEVDSVGEAVLSAMKDRASLRGADLRGADLRGADLLGADFYGADLLGADFYGADLRRVDLRRADLRGADLRGANLRGADLRGADLRDIWVSWSSHDLLAELLRRAAGSNVDRLKFAGLVLVCLEFCWPQFEAVQDPQWDWALGVLAQYFKAGEHLPDAMSAVYRGSKGRDY